CESRQVRHRAERGVTGAPGTLAGQLPDGSPPGNEDILDSAIAQELEAEPTRVATGWRRVSYGVLSNRSLTITIAGLLVFAFFSLTARQFLTANNLLNLILNMSLIGIVAVVMTYLRL